jgi:hypothetical protein
MSVIDIKKVGLFAKLLSRRFYHIHDKKYPTPSNVLDECVYEAAVMIVYLLIMVYWGKYMALAMSIVRTARLYAHFTSWGVLFQAMQVEMDMILAGCIWKSIEIVSIIQSILVTVLFMTLCVVYLRKADKLFAETYMYTHVSALVKHGFSAPPQPPPPLETETTTTIIKDD